MANLISQTSVENKTVMASIIKIKYKNKNSSYFSKVEIVLVNFAQDHALNS